MVVIIQNTFIDCEGTVGDLLTAEESSDLLVRKSKSMPASMLRQARAELEASMRCSELVQDVASLAGLEACERPLSETVSACKRSLPRCPSSDSLASTRASEEAGPPPRPRGDSSLSQESLWDEVLAAEVRRPLGGGGQGEAPRRAVRGEWSDGAEGHLLQGCMPCAFLDSRKGCLQGRTCTYCHLCEPGEKKRRQKAQKQVRLMQRHMMKAMWQAESLYSCT